MPALEESRKSRAEHESSLKSPLAARVSKKRGLREALADKTARYWAIEQLPVWSISPRVMRLFSINIDDPILPIVNAAVIEQQRNDTPLKFVFHAQRSALNIVQFGHAITRTQVFIA